MYHVCHCIERVKGGGSLCFQPSVPGVQSTIGWHNTLRKNPGGRGGSSFKIGQRNMTQVGARASYIPQDSPDNLILPKVLTLHHPPIIIML